MMFAVKLDPHRCMDRRITSVRGSRSSMIRQLLNCADRFCGGQSPSHRTARISDRPSGLWASRPRLARAAEGGCPTWTDLARNRPERRPNCGVVEKFPRNAGRRPSPRAQGAWRSLGLIRSVVAATWSKIALSPGSRRPVDVGRERRDPGLALRVVLARAEVLDQRVLDQQHRRGRSPAGPRSTRRCRRPGAPAGPGR